MEPQSNNRRGRDNRDPSLSMHVTRGHMRTQREGGHLPPKEKVPSKTSPTSTVTLDFPASQTVRK